MAIVPFRCGMLLTAHTLLHTRHNIVSSRFPGLLLVQRLHRGVLTVVFRSGIGTVVHCVLLIKGTKVLSILCSGRPMDSILRLVGTLERYISGMHVRKPCYAYMRVIQRLSRRFHGRRMVTILHRGATIQRYKYGRHRQRNMCILIPKVMSGFAPLHGLQRPNILLRQAIGRYFSIHPLFFRGFFLQKCFFLGMQSMINALRSFSIIAEFL